MWPRIAEAIIEKQIQRIVAGQVDHATARVAAIQSLKQADEWDFSDDAWQRLDETIELNTSLRQLWAAYNGGCDKTVLDQWPAQELQTWDHAETAALEARWTSCGGKIFHGRMIALKNDPIWTAISDYSPPYPPFAKGSSARVSDVTRTEAIKFDLIDRDREIALKRLPPPLGLRGTRRLLDGNNGR